MKRVYLVDDEPLALRRLARMLEATGRVEIAGQSTDPELAAGAIAAARDIDLVFLDISMPDLDGFELCARLPPGVMVVFTTAHDEHALRAFQTNAIDYLLKPIRDDELARALDKLDRLRELPAADASEQLARAMAGILAARSPERIASRLGDRIHLVELDRVTHFVAEDKLTYAVTGERSFVVDASIAVLEERHGRAGFFRIHRATLVRLSAIAELSSTTDGTRVRLADGKTELVVARERARALKDKLGV
ncbi:MAG TPA: LytTR family DNA-binding domain-containing protein [Kofleriaceae bacterium]